MLQSTSESSVSTTVVNDIAEITCRHHAELAMAWWRRETSPKMLLRGTFAHYLELDQKIWAYMDGAGLNTAAMFANLTAHQNPDAPDFIADIVAAFLATSVGGAPDNAAAWVESVRPHRAFAPALEGARRWLGKTAFVPQGAASVEADVHLWHPSHHLRFIDGFGKVQGRYLNQANPAGAVSSPADPQLKTSVLCTHLLSQCKPQAAASQSTQPPFMQWVTEANQQGHDAAAILLAVGISGDANALAWLLQCAVQPTYTVCALDAFRRISGFDALQAVQADRQLISAIEPEVLNQATQRAQQWLQPHGQDFRKDTVYFLGQPITRAHLLQTVRNGYQVDRELAAMRLLQGPEPCLMPVRSNCSIQHRAMLAVQP